MDGARHARVPILLRQIPLGAPRLGRCFISEIKIEFRQAYCMLTETSPWARCGRSKFAIEELGCTVRIRVRNLQNIAAGAEGQARLGKSLAEFRTTSRPANHTPWVPCDGVAANSHPPSQHLFPLSTLGLSRTGQSLFQRPFQGPGPANAPVVRKHLSHGLILESLDSS